MNLKQICVKHNILDYNEMTKLIGLQQPLVTIAMLSFIRPEKLIKALKMHLKNGTPLNMVLRVQGCEKLSKAVRNDITNLVKQFHGHNLQFTETNLGSGIPRHDVLNRAVSKFNTPFIMTTDDDMMWKPYSILAQVHLLQKMPDYGVISSVCTPNYPRKWFDNGALKTAKITKTFVNADMIGSGTSVHRREIFDTCEYDKEYKIGCGDYDFCMQIRRVGWKIGVLNIPELNSLNDAAGSGQDYNRQRYNRPIINKSIARFKKKWNYDL